MDVLAFAEFISSNLFIFLFKNSLHLVNPYLSLGYYLQGLPIKPTTDFIWGTNAGIRTVPILFNLTILQTIFPSLWERIYLIIVLILPFITYLIARKTLESTSIFDVIGALFYAFNIWILNRIFTGFWQLNISYAFVPFLITIPQKLVDTELNFRKLLFFVSVFTLSATLISVGQPHFLVMIGLYLTVHFLLNTKRENYKRLLKFYLFSGLLFCIVNAYLLIPSLLFKEMEFTAPNQYFSLASVIFNGKLDIWSSILGFNPGALPMAFFQYIPLLTVLLLFTLKKQRKWTYLLFIIIFLFLAKGLNTPLSGVSAWLYQYVFFLHYFRDPSRFLAAAALFSAFTFSEFHLPKKFDTKRYKLSLLLITTIILLIIDLPFLDSKKTSVFTEQKIPNEYISLQKYINKNLSTTTKRLLVLPNAHGMYGYPWYKNPSIISTSTIFDMLTPLTIPLADSNYYPDNYSSQISAYFYSEFTKTLNTQILKPLAVKYLLIDSSIIKPEAEKEIPDKFLNNIPKNVQQIKSFNFLHLFSVNNTADTITTNKPIFTAGDFETIRKLYASGDTRPVILLNQFPNTQITNLNILKNEDFYGDINSAIKQIVPERLALKYYVDILKVGWNYDKLFVNMEPYKNKYIQKSGTLFTSGRSVTAIQQGVMDIPISCAPGKYELFIKALADSPTSLPILVNGKNYTFSVNSTDKLTWMQQSVNIDQKCRWLRLVKNDRNMVILDQVVLVPESVYQREKDNVSLILKSMHKVTQISSLKENNPTISSIDQSHVYLKKPSQYLTYRLSYGKYWTSDVSSTKFMSDGYGMTFISNQKISSIQYTPELYYQISLIISTITFSGLVIFIGYCLFSTKLRTHSLLRNKRV